MKRAIPIVTLTMAALCASAANQTWTGAEGDIAVTGLSAVTVILIQ